MDRTETPAHEPRQTRATGSRPVSPRVISEERLLARLRGRARRRLPPGALAGVMSFVGSTGSEARS